MTGRALRYVLPPGPKPPLRSSGVRLLRTEAPTATKGGLVGNRLVGCGCPLTDTPHARDAHALASLRRDIPHVFPREGSYGVPLSEMRSAAETKVHKSRRKDTVGVSHARWNQ